MSKMLMPLTEYFGENHSMKKFRLNTPNGRRSGILLCAMAVILIVARMAHRHWRGDPQRQQLQRYIDAAARRHDVDPSLVTAVIRRESKFDPDACGAKDEVGLMQITPLAVQDWERAWNQSVSGAGRLYSPALNIEIGTWFLGNALRQWKDHEHPVVMALIQYNAGRQRALQWAGQGDGKNIVDQIPIPSTRSYIKSILKYHSEYTAEMANTRQK